MRNLLLACAFALLSTASFAGAMDSRFGNTIIVVDASGNETHLYYAADGTFSGKRGGDKFKGTWKLEGANLCIIADPGPDAPAPQCNPAVARKLGETWTVGEATAKLVPGIQ